MTSKRIIGIDPGVNGALACIYPDGRAVVHKTSNTLPIEAVRDALCGVDPREVVAYVELVGGFIPGRPQPASRAGVLMRNLGQWEGILAALNISVRLVRPQLWQAGIPGVKVEGYSDRKRALKAEATRRFPSLTPTLDMSDALLIADFGRRAES